VLADRYEEVRELARGGMGRVLLVRDRLLERELALKTLLAGDDPHAQLRFVEEAQLTGQLSHPNIVPAYHLGVHRDELFLTLERVRGEDLHGLCKRLGEDPALAEDYPLPRMLRVFLATCRAIAYAHARGLIHRDIKPANVMLGPDDAVRVMDWGLAKPVGSGGGGQGAETVISKVRSDPGLAETDAGLTARGSVVGTPAYMPPEQADGADVDRRADVYSLGALLYELLTLRRPYSGGSLQVLAALFKGAPPPPSQIAPEVPPAVESICLKAMARDPADRYADASELAADVEAYLDEGAVSAHSESLRETLTRLARRHRGSLLATVVAFVLLLVAAAGAAGLVQTFWDRAAAAEARSDSAKAAADAAAEEAATAADVTSRVRAAAAALDAAGARASELREGIARDRSFLRRALAPKELLALHERGRASVKQASELFLQLQGDLLRPKDRLALEASRDDVQRQLDLALAEALVGRDPWLFLEHEADLDLGAELTLLRARALGRAFRREEALEACQARASSQVAPVLSALRLCLARAPARERLPALRRALELRPSAAWLHARLGVAAAQLRGSSLVDAEPATDPAAPSAPDPAQAHFQRALTLAPLDPWILFDYMTWCVAPGLELSVPESTRDAAALNVPEAKTLLKLRTRVLDLWNGDGVDEGGWRRFRAWVEKTANPKRNGGSRLPAAEVWAQGAAAAYTLSRWSAGRELAERGLQADPDHLEARALLARGLLGEGDLDGARRAAAQALALDPEHGLANHVLGQVLRQRGELSEAKAHLALGARGSLAAARWLALAEAHAEDSDPAAWSLGVVAGRRASALDPVYFTWAEFCVPLRPLDPRIPHALGRLRARQGRWAEACLHFGRAAFLEKSRLGLFQRKLRVEPTLAQRLPPEALKEDRSYAKAQAEALRRLGLTAEADALLR
jgi:hypothetical protein